MKIAVIGAGVMGTTCALLIKETFPHTEVVQIAKDFTPYTTSDGAAGLWEPFYLAGTPDELVVKWSKDTFDWAMQMMRNDPESALYGLSTTHGFHVTTNDKSETPFWAHIPYDFAHLTSKELERFPNKVKSGSRYTSVFIEASKLLPKLCEKFKALGGRCIQREIHSFTDLCEHDIVVNCTGLGAEQLCGDTTMVPVRGQVRRVRAPWINEFVIFEDMEENKVSYVLPNQDYVVMGGTVYENDRNLEIDEEDRRHIVQSCEQLFPSLSCGELVCDWVGLRPARSGGVRLEREDVEVVGRGGGVGDAKVLKVVHNYGHGGSGITLHRGCAREVLELVGQCLNGETMVKSRL